MNEQTGKDMREVTKYLNGPASFVYRCSKRSSESITVGIIFFWFERGI